MARRPPVTAPERWSRRQLAGLCLRGAMVVVPFAVSLTTIGVLSRLLPTGQGPTAAARYVVVLGSSFLVMALTHRGMFRLMPLAALLEMSLVFPERAPSRLQLARRVASRRDLEDLLAGRTAHVHESTQQSAERILALVGALSSHDKGTRGHSERVRVLSDLIAARMGVSDLDRDRLRWAALLHDVGKLQVPAEILNKPAQPSPREWDLLRRHPHHGEGMIAPLREWLGGWADVVVQHHEKWDGSGYPLGLSGAQICLGARIVAVADAFDVMTASRAYKKASGRTAALRELVACSGSQFDPAVVRALITVPQQRVLLAMGPAAWLTGLPFLGQGQVALASALTGKAGIAVGAVALTGTAALGPLDGVLPAPVADRVGRTQIAGAREVSSHSVSGAASGSSTAPSAAATPGGDVSPTSEPQEASSAAVPATQPTGAVPTGTPQETAEEEESVSTRPTGAPTTGRKASESSSTSAKSASKSASKSAKSASKSASRSAKSASKSASRSARSASATNTTTTTAPTYTTTSGGKGRRVREK